MGRCFPNRMSCFQSRFHSVDNTENGREWICGIIGEGGSLVRDELHLREGEAVKEVKRLDAELEGG